MHSNLFAACAVYTVAESCITERLIVFLLTCAENSETQMGKDVKYKLLVRALNLDTEEELAQLVSEGFTVSTAASGHGIVCMVHDSSSNTQVLAFMTSVTDILVLSLRWTMPLSRWL